MPFYLPDRIIYICFIDGVRCETCSVSFIEKIIINQYTVNMAKVIFADNILKKKGIEKKNFKSEELNEIIERFFLEHDAKATILAIPKRFIEMENPPEGDIIDHLDGDVWKRRLDDANDLFDFCDYVRVCQKGLNRPILYINEPVIKNAMYYLRDICGFSVTSRTRNKKKEYIISLPI